MCPNEVAAVPHEETVCGKGHGHSDFSKAVSGWRTIVGQEGVVLDWDAIRRYASNEIAAERRVPAVVKPTHTAQVSGVVLVP